MCGDCWGFKGHVILVFLSYFSLRLPRKLVRGAAIGQRRYSNLFQRVSLNAIDLILTFFPRCGDFIDAILSTFT